MGYVLIRSMVLAAWPLSLLGCLTDSPSGEYFPLEGSIRFTVEEKIRYAQDPGPPYFQITLWTEKIYPQICYRILVDTEESREQITLTIRGIWRPAGMCGDAMSPATAIFQPTALAQGERSLQIRSGSCVDKYVIAVSDDLVETREVESTFSQPDYTRVWRVPENSFAYKCGTLCEDFNLCSEFLDNLVAAFGLVELEPPAGAVSPYGPGSGGYYCEIDPVVLQYTDSQTFDLAGGLLADFTAAHLVGRMGAGISLWDWTGAAHMSWLLE